MLDRPIFAAPGTTTTLPGGNSYDDVPYESHPFAQSHPSRMATVATLFGLNPAPVGRCRVLELGCAAGGNLIPIADNYPDSECIGVDLSARQIADGQKQVAALGARNVSLRHASITDVDESYGEFDYIICHGVYSWVPDAVREKILEVCGKRLTPNGVAYVSYNTYPGWHMRGMIRDMMRYHALRFPSPQQRVAQARALLDFLANSVRQDGGAYATLLKAELEGVRQQADYYLYHEHLEDVNVPVYFHQFAERAWEHNLRYLGEARVSTMVTGNFGPEIQKALQIVASNQIHAEQYMDFVRNRMFRETLLVRKDANPDWAIKPEAVRRLHIGVPRRLPDENVDVKSNAPAQYQTRFGMTMTTTSPAIKAAMRVLSQRCPNTLPFDELDREVTALLDGQTDGGQALALGLLNTYLSSDLIEFNGGPISVATTPGEKPVALKAARVRLEAGDKGVATRRHENYLPNDFERRFIPLLDGTRDRAALADRVTQMVVAGELTVRKENVPVTDPAAIREAIVPVIEQSLAGLAGSCLLEPAPAPAAAAAPAGAAAPTPDAPAEPAAV